MGNFFFLSYAKTMLRSRAVSGREQISYIQDVRRPVQTSKFRCFFAHLDSKTFQFALHFGITIGEQLGRSWLDLECRAWLEHIKFDPLLNSWENWTFLQASPSPMPSYSHTVKVVLERNSLDQSTGYTKPERTKGRNGRSHLPFLKVVLFCGEVSLASVFAWLGVVECNCLIIWSKSSL